MSQMYGADTGALRALGSRMDAVAGTLHELEAWLRQLDRSIWRGSDAARFYGDCDQVQLVQLQQVGRALTAIAMELRRQADEQDRASGVDSGSSTSAAVGPTSTAGSGSAGRGFGDHAETVFEVISNVDGGLGLLQLPDGDIFDWGVPKTGFLSMFGAAKGAYDFGSGLGNGDTGKAISGLVDMGLNGVGWLAAGSSAGVLAGTLGVGKAWLEFGVPITNEDQDGLLDWLANDRFGKSRDELSPDEAAWVSNRYSGAGGIASMISDNMDKTADEFVGTVKAVGGAIGSLVDRDAGSGGGDSR